MLCFPIVIFISLTDKFKFDVSESESTIVNGKMDKKNSSSDMAAAFTATLKESNNNDKSQVENTVA